MDDEKLILLVKERTELYNKYNPLFKYLDKKQEAWMDIANEMEMTADDCMKRWSCLRDRFTREIKQMEQHKGTGYRMIWPFFEMMEFIRPFVTPRRFRRVKRFSKLPRHLTNTNYQTPPALVEKRSPLPSPTPSVSVSPAASATECGDFNQIFEDPLIQAPLPPKEIIISNPNVDKSFCEAVETLKKACALNEARHANPAVHAFGEMIVSTICRMNSRNQLRAMQQVTDTVMRIKLEEDELLEQVSYSTL